MLHEMKILLYKSLTTFEAFHKYILLSADLLFLMSDKLIKMILLLYYEEKKNDFLLQAISNFLFDFVFQSVLPLLVCCLAGKIFFFKKALYSKANFNKLLFGKIIKSIQFTLLMFVLDVLKY